MPTQQYAVVPQHIETLLTWIKSGEIAIPEIQRPFVWSAVKVRDLLDSLYKGFPVGYLIAWRNPNVKLKDGTMSAGKRILVDGQQRVTALMAALLAFEVVDSDYRTSRITIGFHPMEERFEVSNPAIARDPTWIADVATVFDPETSMFDLVNEYCRLNPQYGQNEVFRNLESLKGITSNQIGVIELDSNLDIDTVTEIFIRVNSQGVPLSQADFAMSKIAVNEECGGPLIRKAIDYFCHLAVAPEFYSVVERDASFKDSEYFGQMAWLKDEKDDLYDPSYTDLLRVAFTSQFQRGRLEDLVALLSGRNFQTRAYEQEIIEDSFESLKGGLAQFMNETNFKRFIMIVRSAGFVSSSMITSQATLDFAYILYLTLKSQGNPPGDIEQQVRRWLVFSILTGRYTGSPETAFDFDIRQVHQIGIEEYAETIFRGELSDAFWDAALPQAMVTSSANSPYFKAFQASQIKMNDRGFLSRDLTVRELVEVRSDVHHLFPSAYLKDHGVSRGQYNQIANYGITQSEINIAIGRKEPKVYFNELLEQCNGGRKRYGNIDNLKDLRQNLEMNCIPAGVEDMTVDAYPEFLSKRRQLMANKLKNYFSTL